MNTYLKERQNGTACGVLRCKYFCILNEQNCSGEYNGENAVVVCADYAPETNEFESDRDKEIYYRQNLSQEDCEKNVL